jgi:AcrR family transcriptional regulator
VTPRAYSLARRAASSAATRRRILDAAVATYRERGIEGARIAEIAARADVSRGTVLNHFGSPDGLLGAVLDEVLASLDMPDERVLEGATSDDDRIRRFLEAILRFNDRSGEWWAVFTDERHNLPDIPALKAKEQQFWEQLGKLQIAALGPLVTDRVFAATLAGTMQSGLVFTLRGAGLSLDEAIEVTTTMLLAILHRERGR